MPIDTLHPAFFALVEVRKMMRDVMDGEEAVKKAKEAYLPKLGGRETSDDDYDAYRKRAQFVGACARTLEALAGAVCRKAPKIHGPEEFATKYTADITGSGVSLASFVGQMVREVLTVRSFGVLVDHDGVRPGLRGYVAENVTNILPDETVVLREYAYQADPQDRFSLSLVTSYREVKPTDNGGAAVVVWTKPNGGQWTAGDETELTFRGDPINVIPFVLCDMPIMPLLPLAEANLSHYRTSADLENGLHWGGTFTPWIAANIDAQSEASPSFIIGGNTAWVLPTGSQVGMLEIQGAALSALEERLKGKEETMAALGARLLVAQKKTAETEQTARINAGGEGATLAMVVDTVEAALTSALRIMAAWDGQPPDDIHVELNREFVDSRLTPDQITAYLAAYQAGGMSLDTLLNLLMGGGLFPSDRTVEEEKSLISSEAPPMAGGGDPGLSALDRLNARAKAMDKSSGGGA
jgi:hypothetical protein